ncbi:uncharacterized protein LOC124131485 [Haliotis rufescens]|uniref:uncharacterized protein LOC124131485 n=1 Tax=Haliotis rufescens TaxID=6454 RepID=UPI00201E7CF2|nr:uncharacterized protein LOC124131485 [Haliotis rufescens]
MSRPNLSTAVADRYPRPIGRIVPDDNRCETLTTDFSGFKVDAQPIRGLNTSDVPASFNNTGLFIITIHITGEVDVSDLLSSVQQNCSTCLRAFEVLGSKPKKYVLVGNIPLDQLDDIVSSLTPGQDDTATTKRVIDFNTFAKEHSRGCIDVHKQHAEHQPVHVDYKPVHVDYKPVRVDYKPVHVDHKPVKIDYQPVNVEYKPVPAPTPRPSNGPSKSVSLRQSHEPKTPTRFIPEAPESPKVNFPKIEQNFYGQTEHDKVQDDHFQNINFPSTRKSQTGYAQPNFNGFGVQAKSNRFDTNHPGFGLSLHDNPSSRYVF